jgi:hypothetical protein
MLRYMCLYATIYVSVSYYICTVCYDRSVLIARAIALHIHICTYIYVYIDIYRFKCLRDIYRFK